MIFKDQSNVNQFFDIQISELIIESKTKESHKSIKIITSLPFSPPPPLALSSRSSEPNKVLHLHCKTE
jgi:hypothetical protein